MDNAVSDFGSGTISLMYRLLVQPILLYCCQKLHYSLFVCDPLDETQPRIFVAAHVSPLCAGFESRCDAPLAFSIYS